MNLVFCAYAHKDSFQGGHNMKCADSKNTYLKNSFVALKSCKAYNPETQVALVTNVSLDDYWKDLFNRNGISVIYTEYDSFVFEKQYGWSLAFYKLCALKHVLTLGYDNLLLLDTDTYTQKSIADIWQEAENNILLYDISKGLYNGDYNGFVKEAQAFLDTKEHLTRWGGEFIAGNTEDLKLFMAECENLYHQICQRGFKTINGDEFITSIAAWKMRHKVKNAGAYVFRYWTAFHWHFVCSNYRYNPVCVLHCPREKDHGFLKLFRWMSKHNELPKISKVYRYLNLDLLSYIKLEIIRKFL